MFKRIGLLLLIIMLASSVVFAQETTPEATQPAVTAAEQILTLFETGDYAAIHALLSPQVQGMVTAEQLGEAWESLSAQVGAFQGTVGTRYESDTGTGVITLQFELIALELRVRVDTSGQVVALNFAPASAPEDAPAEPTYSAPPYADEDTFTDIEVILGTVGETPLPGVLSLPNGDGLHPLVILMGGSGPTDRDGTVGGNKPLRDLAWGLATQGIAVLRYDKRALVHPDSFANTFFTIAEEYTQDALLAVELMRATAGIDPERVYLAGHSLGGYIAPRIVAEAAAADSHIAGVIVLAGLARPLQDALFDQQRYLLQADGALDGSDQMVLSIVNDLRNAINGLTEEDADDSYNLFGAPPSYYIDLQGYDPVATAAGLDVPLLVIQGERDYQVTMAGDFALWQAGLEGDPNATLISYPSLNHLLIPGSGASLPSEYGVAGHVDGAVINDIAAWVNER
ncbi:MAG: alpha/beta fold hydrolase [Anaerolinea sp.]|nr:alpha/beta fold hydrolase [Anaerolinea sp.]